MNESTSNIRVIAVVILVCTLLQIAIAPNMRIGTVTPNFLLIPIVSCGLLNGPQKGCGVGFACGLITDFCTVGPVGGMALVGMVIGLVCGLLSQAIFSEGWAAPLVIIVVCALFANIAQAILLALVGANEAFLSSLIQVVLPKTLYDAILACAFFPLARHFFAPVNKGMHRSNKLL